MSTTTELKPCPFCGGEPILNHIEPHTHHLMFNGEPLMPDYSGSWTIECCDVGMIKDSREEVITAWNRRSAAHGEPQSCGNCVMCEYGRFENCLTKQAGSAEQVSERELASMLVAFANDDSIPKLDDDEIRAICQSRGWTPTDTPSLRELAHVFYAEGCAAQRRALQHTAPAPNDQAEEDAAIIYKLGSVLAEIAIALKGEELPPHRHSYHDLADLVRIKVLECDLLKMQVEELKEAAPSKAGEWTDEQIKDAADEHADTVVGRYWEFHGEDQLRAFARALLSAAPAQAAQSEDAKRLEIKVCCLGDHPGDVFIFEINGKITIPLLQDMEEALQEDMAEDNGTFHGTGDYTFEATYNEAERGDYGQIYAPAYWDFTEIAFKPNMDAAMSTPSEKE